MVMAGATAEPVALWLDCDPGHDDAIAIIVAGFSPQVQLVGISTVAGNQTVDKVTRNALHILDIAGLTHIDVVTGQSGPILRSLPRLCPEIHGDSGLDCKEGGHIFGESLPTTKSISGKCVNVMFKRLSEAFTKSGRQRVSLVCTGPLTNCAMLLLVYPEVQEMVDVVVMGGCMGIGNTGPVMEFNIQSDPEAAKIVFESGVHLTMVPLEVTHRALVTEDVLARILTNKPTPFRQTVKELVTFFSQTYKSIFHFDNPPLHDPCAVAYVIKPEIFQVEEMRVDIETNSELSAGQTICDVWGQSGKVANCRVATNMTVEYFWEIVLDGVAAADLSSPLNKH